MIDGINPTGYAQVIEERGDGGTLKSYTLGQDVIGHATDAVGYATIEEDVPEDAVRYLLYDVHGSTRQHAYGIMDLDLDELANTEAPRREARSFFRRIGRYLDQYAVPAALLNNYLAPSIQFIKDIPLAPIRDALNKIQNALAT